MAQLRVALAQLNVTVGDLDGNRRLIAGAIRRAEAWMADVVLVPELALTGYPPEDLLLKSGFVEASERALASLSTACRGLTAVVGFVRRGRDGRLRNSAAVLSGGRVAAVYDKQCLPNYGVFDEQRYFAPGAGPLVLTLAGVRCGVTICEDLWREAPARQLAAAGAAVMLNLSASPYHARKAQERARLFAQRARANRLAIAYCNLVGGQDELVFDGASLAVDASGRVLAQAAQFEESLTVVDLPTGAVPHRAPLHPQVTPGRPLVEEVYGALRLGVRDYVRKNGFATVVLGLSGGIDSALTACLAVDALGPSHVAGVVMPSRFSSKETQADARQLARGLGIELKEIPIEPLYAAYLKALAPHFGDRPADIAEQNLQARIRGTLLMALSNKFGWLVLTTGNKSEFATGYTTLYGDMAGGLAVIKDVPKTLVYELAKYRNRLAHVIPERILTRAPTAELAPNQTDQDRLPPYDVLDRILRAYVEEDRSLHEILSRNQVQPDTVRQVIGMVDYAEYKRRQGPPGIKITPKAFGRDRRMPITNRYRQA